MKPTGEHRKHERYPVQFKSIFSTDGVHIEEGLMLDLSLGGCRLTSAIHVPSGIPLELQIRPDQHSPIYVATAVVCWEENSDFGLAFKELPELQSSKLTRLLWSCTSEGRMVHEICSLWREHAAQSVASRLPSVHDRLTGVRTDE